tara:strand:- start:5133 stop:7535 length:2403 start_codon:yes stop_codon:yes gene_type:complete
MKISKILISFFAILVLLFFSNFIKNFKIDASSDTLILQNDEDFKYFNYYNKVFPTKNFLVLAISSNEIIDENYIKKINTLKNKLMKIKEIDSIFSIVDAPILLTNNLQLTDLKNTIENINNTEITLSKVLKEFSNNPLYVNQIISQDKKISSLIIYLKKDQIFLKLKENKNLSSNNLNEYKKNKDIQNKKRQELIKNIRIIINEEQNNDTKLNNKFNYYLGGIDMIIDDSITYVKKDILFFSFSVTLFIFIILFIIFKNIKWVIIPLISSGYSIIIMIGLMGLFKWEVTAISSNFISLMLILSISMSIHIINNYKKNYNNKDIQEPIKTTLTNMFWPCFYTALTTIVAFSSLIFSDIKPIIDFGIIMIVALFLIFLTSFTILPLLIYIWPTIDNKKNLNLIVLKYFSNLSLNNSLKIIVINLIVVSISIYGIKNLSVENSFINYFKKNTEIYKGMKIIDENLGGTTPLDIIIKFNDEDLQDNQIVTNKENDFESDEDDLFEDLELVDELFSDDNIWFNEEKIRVVTEIHKFLENKKEIGKVQSIYSLIDIANQINKKNLSSFELSVLYNEVPENYKKDLLDPYLSIDENMVKINARVKDSAEINRDKLIKDINLELNSLYKNNVEIKINGLLILYNNMLQSLFSSQINSLGIVILAIFVMFLILFKSFKLSIIGIIPNILASSIILGILGLFKIPLDIMTVTIAAITIGIAVDNTIHYLYRYKENNLKLMNIEKSIQKTHENVGNAVLTTSITIAFGFSVLAFSNFIPTVLFGIFTALAMLIAMIGVLLTLPSLLKRFSK